MACYAGACNMFVVASEVQQSKPIFCLLLIVQITATEVRFVDRAQAPSSGQQQGGWGPAQPQQAGWGQAQPQQQQVQVSPTMQT